MHYILKRIGLRLVYGRNIHEFNKAQRAQQMKPVFLLHTVLLQRSNYVYYYYYYYSSFFL